MIPPPGKLREASGLSLLLLAELSVCLACVPSSLDDPAAALVRLSSSRLRHGISMR